MAMRPTLAALVSRLRRMVGDGACAIWTDDELADTLDRYRTNQRQVQIDGVVERTPTLNGWTIAYYDYRAPVYSDWELGATLVNRYFETVDPNTFLFNAGNSTWTFNTARNGWDPYYYATGVTYCLPSAAVELLKERLATHLESVDTRDKDAEKKYSQVSSQIQKSIATYEAMIPVTSARAYRSDVQ